MSSADSFDEIEDEYLDLLCSGGEISANSEIRRRHRLSNAQLVLMTKGSRFKQKLHDWTYTYSYLPSHAELMQSKIDSAMQGNLEADRDLRAAYLGEVKGILRRTTEEVELPLRSLDEMFLRNFKLQHGLISPEEAELDGARLVASGCESLGEPLVSGEVVRSGWLSEECPGGGGVHGPSVSDIASDGDVGSCAEREAGMDVRLGSVDQSILRKQSVGQDDGIDHDGFELGSRSEDVGES